MSGRLAGTGAWPGHAPGAIGLVLCLLLAACGDAVPEPVQPVPPPVATVELEGPLRVHYNLLPTLALGEAVAREYGVERSDGTALLVLALRRPTADGDETMAEGQVDAEVVDLSGRRQAVALRPVATGDYTDHVGTVKIGPRDTLRVEVVVTADGRRQRFDFQRSF
ncbi:MAG: DUF4426 domain-containing protein [Proteobacteria bacterium]|nr:DUF4426 domain-containing protein [Pseudomonadota bacterium]